MPKNLIYQYYAERGQSPAYIRPNFQYYKLSEQSISAYAKKHGAEYKMLSGELPAGLPMFFGIFVPFFEDWAKEYDNICFMDSDILATINAKNVFNFASDTAISAYFMDTRRRWGKSKLDAFWADKGHANSGVVVFPRAIYDQMREYAVPSNIWRPKAPLQFSKALGDFDQAAINFFMRDTNNYAVLPRSFNYHMQRYGTTPAGAAARWGQDLIHYHRRHKNLMQTDFQDSRILK